MECESGAGGGRRRVGNKRMMTMIVVIMIKVFKEHSRYYNNGVCVCVCVYHVFALLHLYKYELRHFVWWMAEWALSPVYFVCIFLVCFPWFNDV